MVFNLIYRLCDKVNACSICRRCFDVSKNALIKKCALSIKASIENISSDIDFNFYCIYDNCSTDIIDFIKTIYSDIIFIELKKHGNAGSFCECVDTVLNFPDDQICYFLEDDYLFLNNNVFNLIYKNLIFLNKINNTKCAIFPDDYNDRYINNKINTECVVTETGHFIRVGSTTCTFVTFSDVVKKYKNDLLKFSEWPLVTESDSINRLWHDVPLYSPIPGYTLHSQAKSIIPPYLEFKKLQNYFEK